ncbi:MAG TPA: hypothetical protein PK975_01095 [Candidatus Hydrogenedentes bacterium]|nr:hypothetical protein [Candidatus Hydrogenedentota bacterium]
MPARQRVCVIAEHGSVPAYYNIGLLMANQPLFDEFPSLRKSVDSGEDSTLDSPHKFSYRRV